MSEPFKPPVRRRGSFLYADIALCLGPLDHARTDKGTDLASLFGYAWALFEEDGALRFYRYRSNRWFISGFVDVPNASHVALAFDQSARDVVAYVNGFGNQIEIRYWDEAQRKHVFRSFPGVDPVLINDVLAHYRLEDSDVVLFYLSQDRTKVLARIQRERYDTPREVATLNEPAYLDQAVPLPYQVQLLLSREAESLTLTSELYPYTGGLEHYADVSALRGGVYKTNLVLYEGQDALTGSLSALQGGSYEENLQQYAAEDAHSAALSALRGGAYEENILKGRQEQALGAQLSALRGGEFAQSVLPYSRNPASISGSVGALRGGSYEEV